MASELQVDRLLVCRPFHTLVEYAHTMYVARAANLQPARRSARRDIRPCSQPCANVPIRGDLMKERDRAHRSVAGTDKHRA